MHILYLHPAGTFGGASKSLIELFSVLRDKGVVGTVLTPSGSAATAFAKAGMKVITVLGLSQFDNTRYGHYRRLRWIILLRELFLLPFSIWALWRLRREQFDLIHVNEITLLPLALLAKRWLQKPMVVHVRSLQRKPNDGWRTKLITRWLERYADALVAIDETVARTLDPKLPHQVVHNGLRIRTRTSLVGDERNGPDRSIRVGFLGVLVPLKGIYELMEAIRILKFRNVRVECLIAGENAHDLSGVVAWLLRRLGLARDVRTDLERFIVKYSLQSEIRLQGFVEDVAEVYSKIDVLCFPSHLDAVGRPVFEAAYFQVPSIVAVSDPTPDALIHGVTGLAIQQPDPVLLADAIQLLGEQDMYRRSLGSKAFEWANHIFDLDTNATIMQKIYRQLLEEPDCQKA